MSPAGMDAVAEAEAGQEAPLDVPFESGVAFIGLLKTVIASLTREVGRRLSSYGLTDAQWVPILLLARGHCRTVAEIARWNDSDPGATTRTITRLEAKGMLSRVRSRTDRRVVELHLTDLGREVAGRVPALLSQVFNLHLSGFEEGEWRLMLQLLSRMKAGGALLDAWTGRDGA